MSDRFAAGDDVEPDVSIGLAGSVEAARADVSEAAAELIRLRGEIAGLRAPLSRDLKDLEMRVADRRATVERLRRQRRREEMEHEALSREVPVLEEEWQFLSTALTEYRRSLETRAHVAESVLLKEELEQIDRLLRKEDMVPASRSLLGLAARRNRRRVGGSIFEGMCLDRKGIEHAGRFAILGPVAYFAGGKAGAAGIAVSRLGSPMPTLLELPATGKTDPITHLLSGGDATLPVDLTGGKALQLRESRQSLYEHAMAGGVVMVPLLGIALAAILLIAWKWRRLHGQRTASEKEIEKIADQLLGGNIVAAKEAVAGLGCPLDSILLEGIEHRDAPKEHIEEILHERVQMYIPVLERHLGALAVLGGVSPLLGLLGTVTGMIHTFQLVMVFGTGDAKMLSGGISEALVTTAFGLIIAIPVMLAHAFLARRVKSVISTLEQRVVAFLNRMEYTEPAPRGSVRRRDRL